MKSSSCSQEYPRQCVCTIFSLSHTCMHTQPLNSLFLCSQLVRCEAIEIPGLCDHKGGPKWTLSLIKVYKLGLNATVACGLSKLCAQTDKAHSCLFCTGYPREKEYCFFFFQVREEISIKNQKLRNQKLQDNKKIIFTAIASAPELMLHTASHEKSGQEPQIAGMCKW